MHGEGKYGRKGSMKSGLWKRGKLVEYIID